MKQEFFSHLMEVSSRDKSRVLSNGRVCFDLNGISLVIDFESPYLFSEGVSNLYTIEILPTILNRQTIQTLSLYFGYGKPFSNHRVPKPISITGTMYQLVKTIQNFNPKAILSFDTFQDFDGIVKDLDWYCDEEYPCLIFKIGLDTELGATPDVINLISIFGKELPQIILDYSFFPKEENKEQLEDDFDLHILHSNTKARRLGYLKLLSILFSEGKQFPVNRFNKAVEEAALMVKDQLLEHKNAKGEIKKTHSGISAKPYVELAQDLNMLYLIRNLVVQGKMFKVYSELRYIIPSNGNIFELDKLDKLFFLEQILRHDAFYIFVILESLFLLGELNLMTLQSDFQERVLKKLKKFEEFAKAKGEDKKAIELQKVRKRIDDWNKPEKYLEHVLMPRLNWLFDLDIISILKKNTFVLGKRGEKLLKHYWDWQDIYGGVLVNPEKILDYIYIFLFSDLYEEKNGNEQTFEIIKMRIKNALFKSFDHFSTIAPNRVTASQAISFTQYTLFLNESTKISKPFIKELLNKEFNDIFVYKFHPQYGDGYIQNLSNYEF
jgi:hypothetical protein